MIDIIIKVSEYQSDAEDILHSAATFALRYMQREGDVGIMLVDDEGIRKVNRDYRGIDSKTDVLSFPSMDGDAIAEIPDAFLGDIMISYPTACAQAEEYGHTLKRELAFLTVHGILHLLGYDHMQEDEKETMFRLQKEILNDMRAKQ